LKRHHLIWPGQLSAVAPAVAPAAAPALQAVSNPSGQARALHNKEM